MLNYFTWSKYDHTDGSSPWLPNADITAGLHFQTARHPGKKSLRMMHVDTIT